ncbi:MAG: hypothetical protein NWF07_13060 [Candidatus Bathyarchaeota archaeon]|nr:hypothetical protein [Candidatus Bathyarchaeota archaeon]
MPYNYLPGFDVLMKDGGLVIDSSDFSTGSLLIIGTKDSGSDLDTQEVNPRWVGSQSTFESYFGTAVATNPLFVAWKQAVDAGCKDIRICELAGATADTKYENLHTVYKNLEDYAVDNIVVVGTYGDDTLTTPDLTGEVLDYSQYMGTLTVVTAEATTPVALEVTLDYGYVVEGSVKVYDDGVLATETYTVDYLTGVITFDSAAPSGTITVDYNYYAGVTQGFAAQLAGFCYAASLKNSQVLGFMALGPADSNSLSDVKTYLDGLGVQEFNGSLSLIAGPQAAFKLTDGTTCLDSGVAAYAGYVATLAAQSSTTNKALPGAVALNYNPSPAQLDALCSKNIVSYRIKNGRIIITDGVTTAGQSSDYTRLTTMRIANDVVEAVQEVCDPFIGEPNDIAQRNALNTAIRSALQAMVKVGAIQAFRFSVSATLSQIISGRMNVVVEVIPAFEVRKITLTVAMRPSL